VPNVLRFHGPDSSSWCVRLIWAQILLFLRSAPYVAGYCVRLSWRPTARRYVISGQGVDHETRDWIWGLVSWPWFECSHAQSKDPWITTPHRDNRM